MTKTAAMKPKQFQHLTDAHVAEMLNGVLDGMVEQGLPLQSLLCGLALTLGDYMADMRFQAGVNVHAATETVWADLLARARQACLVRTTERAGVTVQPNPLADDGGVH
jgi:hypothetical protein